MIHHIVSWNFKEGMTLEEKQAAAVQIQEKLDLVTEAMEGCYSCEIKMPLLDTSSADMMLHGRYDSVETLAAYQVHPIHLEAVAIIKANCCNRTCCDFEAQE